MNRDIVHCAFTMEEFAGKQSLFLCGFREWELRGWVSKGRGAKRGCYFMPFCDLEDVFALRGLFDL